MRVAESDGGANYLESIEQAVVLTILRAKCNNHRKAEGSIDCFFHSYSVCVCLERR
ncbi:MAG: hypothetical protein ACI8UP_002872 [Porticoccaceae bacterium]|jgi:hypothetical protein